MERNLRNAFTLWMREQHPDVTLMDDQDAVVDAFCKMSPACRTGKTFVIGLLEGFDAQTGGNVATLIPYFDRHDDDVSCVNQGQYVDWNPDEQKLPF